MEDDVDRAAARMTLSAGVGVLYGASLGVLRGISIPKTAIRSGFSAALAATACFGCERIANICLQTIDPQGRGHAMQQLSSHLVGGIAGGGLLGGMYNGKPMAGMALFTPLMILVFFGEGWVDSYRELRLKQILEQQGIEGFEETPKERRR